MEVESLQVTTTFFKPRDERACLEFMSAQFSMASRTFEGPHVHDCWSPPPHGWIKINCDVSRSQATKLFGMVAIF
ncbi:hypothetical protein V6N13_083195 [Hibiscus sabdariffa]